MNPIEQLHREIDQLPAPLAQEALDLRVSAPSYPGVPP